MFLIDYWLFVAVSRPLSLCMFFPSAPSPSQVKHLFISCLTQWDIKLSLCAVLSSNEMLDWHFRVVPSDVLLMCALIPTIFLLNRGEIIKLYVLHLSDPL